MKRHEYLDRLGAKLRENNVADIDDILCEYEEHFRCKIADGYAEEEVAAKLGDPETVAAQFCSRGGRENESGEENGAGKAGGRETRGRAAIVAAGLILLDLFGGAFFVMLFVWVVVMAALTVASAAIGVCLIGKLNVYSLLPPMPYKCAAVFAIAFFALTVLSAAGTVYCAVFARQLVRAYGRFHGNSIAAASGRGELPPLPVHPTFSGKTRRMLRAVTLISLTVFAIGLIAAYTVSALSAGALGYRHVWGGFVK